jgi:2'-5' RNA ligase
MIWPARFTPLGLALAIAASFAARAAEPTAGASHDGERIIAIDVLLEPSADMARFAETANEGLRRAYPVGFRLGAHQAPHISLVHGYVRAGDLPRLEAKLAAVFADNNPLIIQLTATGYQHSEWDGLALMTIGIEHSDALARVQAKVAGAVEEFSVAEGGSAAAFAVNAELPKIDASIVSYVREFVPNSSGKNYKPHITVGVVQKSLARDIEAVGFPHRAFRPAAAAIYQLGNFGTAQKKLWSWEPGASKP